MNSSDVSLGRLFRTFFRMGLSGFGGALPFARIALVERDGWLTGDQFNELLGICQVLPGPNVVNLSICVGNRARGARGALVAVSAFLVPPFFLMLAVGLAYAWLGNRGWVHRSLWGMACAAAGLLLATGLKMGRSLPLRDWVPAALVFLAVAHLRIPLPWVLAVYVPLRTLWVARS